MNKVYGEFAALCLGLSGDKQCVLISLGPPCGGNTMYRPIEEGQWYNDIITVLEDLDKNNALPLLIQFHTNFNGEIIGFDWGKPQTWNWETER